MTIKLIETSAGELYTGPMPDYQMLCSLERLGIDLIWNLAPELSELAHREQYFVDTVLCGGIEDYSVPNDDSKFLKQLDHVVGLLKNDGKVFAHCIACHGRTPMTVACIKIVLDGYTPDGALALVKEMFNGPETEEQCAFVKSIAVSSEGKAIRI